MPNSIFDAFLNYIQFLELQAPHDCIFDQHFVQFTKLLRPKDAYIDSCVLDNTFNYYYLSISQAYLTFS